MAKFSSWILQQLFFIYVLNYLGTGHVNADILLQFFRPTSDSSPLNQRSMNTRHLFGEHKQNLRILDPYLKVLLNGVNGANGKSVHQQNKLSPNLPGERNTLNNLENQHTAGLKPLSKFAFGVASSNHRQTLANDNLLDPNSWNGFDTSKNKPKINIDHFSNTAKTYGAILSAVLETPTTSKPSIRLKFNSRLTSPNPKQNNLKHRFGAFSDNISNYGTTRTPGIIDIIRKLNTRVPFKQGNEINKPNVPRVHLATTRTLPTTSTTTIRVTPRKRTTSTVATTVSSTPLTTSTLSTTSSQPTTELSTLPSTEQYLPTTLETSTSQTTMETTTSQASFETSPSQTTEFMSTVNDAEYTTVDSLNNTTTESVSTVNGLTTSSDISSSTPTYTSEGPTSTVNDSTNSSYSSPIESTTEAFTVTTDVTNSTENVTTDVMYTSQPENGTMLPTTAILNDTETNVTLSSADTTVIQGNHTSDSQNDSTINITTSFPETVTTSGNQEESTPSNNSIVTTTTSMNSTKTVQTTRTERQCATESCGHFSSICMNGGTCISVCAEHKCICPDGFYGFFCDKRQPPTTDVTAM